MGIGSVLARETMCFELMSLLPAFYRSAKELKWLSEK
jgi:hypothetical protein